MKTAFETIVVLDRKITICAVSDAHRITGKIHIGHSVCMKEDLPNYDKALARSIAKGRALSKSKLSSHLVVTEDIAIINNYGVLKSFAKAWCNKVEANPSKYIKGIRK